MDDLDNLIIAVAEKRDKAAFRILFEHFAPRVKAFTLRRAKDGQLAEEVVQETMVRIWQKADRFDPTKARASTWVFTIARNLHIDLVRRARRPEPDPDDPALVPDDRPSGFEIVNRAQEAERLTKAMQSLPEEQRAVLEHAFFEELTHPEISQRLALPLGTVKSRIRLALKRIRLELGDKQ